MAIAHPRGGGPTAPYLAGLLLMACPPVSNLDGGRDGSSPDGGGDAGVDAGTPSDDACDFTARPCDAGSCTGMLLDDGGVAKRCVVGGCDLVAQDCDAGLK